MDIVCDSCLSSLRAPIHRLSFLCYRDREGNWLASQPITHQEFISQEEKRKRYWIRSLLGWPFMRDARPNAGHDALANLETQGKVSLLITQNVL